MNNNLFSKFVPIVRSLSEAELAAEIEQPQRLLIESASLARSGSTWCMHLSTM